MTHRDPGPRRTERREAAPRLLVISSEFPPGPGGIGTHACELARGLRARGWEVSVVTSQDYAPSDEITAFNSSLGFRLTRLRRIPASWAEGVYRLAVIDRECDRFRPDLLLSTGQRSVWVASVVAWWRRLPMLAVAHGSEFGGGLLPQAVTRRAFRRATARVGVSQYTLARMRAFGVQEAESYVIPNGADHRAFYPLDRNRVRRYLAERGLEGKRLLVTLGNVGFRKAQDNVIRALPRIVSEISAVHYVMAGLPSREREFATLAASLGVSGHVSFLGRVDAEEVCLLLNAADLFLMTSRHTADGDFEGYGISVVEAALCAIPAIVSKESGLQEAIEDEVTGIAVPPEAISTIAEVVLRLLRDDTLRLRLGAAARERALSQQTWERRVAEYDPILRRLAAHPRREP